MASADGSKRQTDIPDMLAHNGNAESTKDQVGLHEANTSTMEQQNCGHSDTAWPAEIMKN